MKQFFLIGAAVLFLIPAFSQTVALPDTANVTNIRKLLELTGSAKLQKQMMGTMLKSFRQAMPDVNDEFWSEFEKQIDFNELTAMMIPIYQKHFTNEDILKIIQFYESPAGQKFVQELPAIAQESMLAGQEWGQALGLKVQKQLEEKEKK
jgi:hypothetical protein